MSKLEEAIDDLCNIIWSYGYKGSREFGADYQKARLALLKEFKKLTEDNKEMRERIQKAAKYLMDDEDYDSGYNALRALGYV